MPKASIAMKVLGIATVAAAGVLAVKAARKRRDVELAEGRRIASSSRSARAAERGNR